MPTIDFNEATNGDISDLQSDLDTLQLEVDGIEIDTSSLFASGVNIQSSLTALTSRVDLLKLVSASSPLHLYADGTNGNNANTGLSVTQPKKTLLALSALIPDSITGTDFVIAHLSGVFSTIGQVPIDTFVSQSATLLIDGDASNLEVISGPHVADIATVSGIGLTTLGATVDTFGGQCVKIIAGTASGQLRTIMENTATTLFVNRAFTLAPTASTFQICRPATKFTTSGAITLAIGGTGFVQLQNVTIDTVSVFSKAGNMSFGTVVVEAVPAAGFGGGQGGIWTPGNFNYSTTGGTDANNRGTLGYRSTTACSVISCSSISLLDGYFRAFTTTNSMMNMNGPFRCRGLFSINRCATAPGSFLLAQSSTSNYVPTVDNPSGDGIAIVDSNVVFAKTLPGQVRNCIGGHGITGEKSEITFSGVLTGGGNTKTGVTIKNLSLVQVANNNVPTLTGTIGNFGFGAGTTSAGTWTGLDTGVAVVNSGEFSKFTEY